MVDKLSIEEQIRNLKMEEAPPDLLARITTVVPHLPQQQPAAPAAKGFWPVVERFVAEWQYGLSLKIAALGVVAVMGAMTGHADHHGGNAFGKLVFGDISVEDVI